MHDSNVHIVFRTDRGLVRAVNEDSVRVDALRGLVVLADGMGGYRAGEVASSIAVTTVRDALAADPQLTPAAAVVTANEEILAAMADDESLKGMGTTVVAGRFAGGCLEYAHVGDSRLYHWRDGRLTQLTRDHSMMQRVLDEGRYPSRAAALRAGVKTNLLTRGVGLCAQLEVDSASVRTAPGDLFLFCSDGLSNMLSDRAIARILVDFPGEIEFAADRLLTLALERGGYDNISMALVAVLQAPVAGESVRGAHAV